MNVKGWWRALKLAIGASGTDATFDTSALTAPRTVSMSDANMLILPADATAARAALGLGTAATQNTGTSGATIPLLNGINTFSGETYFNEKINLSNGFTAGSDIDSLLPGSTFGGLIQGHSAGHIVIGIRDNDTTDSFAIVSGGGNYFTDTTYDTLCMRVDIYGNVYAKVAYYANNVKVVGSRITGWAPPTGTANRAAFDTATVTVEQLAQRLKALIDDLHASSGGHGLIGP